MHGYDTKLPIYCYPTWLFSVSGPVDMLPCNEILSLRHDFVLKLI